MVGVGGQRGRGVVGMGDGRSGKWGLGGWLAAQEVSDRAACGIQYAASEEGVPPGSGLGLGVL